MILPLLILLAGAATPSPEMIHSRGNPILSDGRFYSTDPIAGLNGLTVACSNRQATAV
ncbi:hypothetical protein ACQHGV_16315 (plasmid) [Sphingomonas pseudosanguinis]|uniref:hypothetical protein n=1 Tax=Sphingomonas pseudosanguinis TaxID=413712 RepID=UPI003F846C12